MTLPLDQRHLPLSQAFDELEAMSKKSKDLPLPLYPIQEVPSLPNLPSLDSECCSEVKNNFNEKKVDFLDIVQYSDPPTDSFDDDPTQPEKLPMLPPPNLRPQKGILKFSHGYIHPSLSSLLESCLKALGGSDVFSRRDAYINLSNILRGYDNVLDSLSLKSRLHQLCQYIERDLSASDDDRDPTSSLVPPALTLINSLQFNSTVIDDLPIKFRIFVVEYAIKALEDPLIPRDIIRNIMFVVANQNFSPKVMTSERFGRLVKALHIVEENDKRKRIITGRIEIFQNLLKNSKSLMAIHTVWIENLLCDMNSSLKDIQLSAIKFGFEAAVKLGTEYSVSGTLCALLKSKFKNGELYGTVYTQTLMKKSKQENGKLVPQIWSILILFQRHRPQILAESSFLKPLLAVLTNCLSQRSSIIQKEALYAWNRFIFSVQLSDKTPKSLREILIRPYIHSLSHQRAFHVLPSMFNLLYYAFRPGCSSTQLDIYWDEFVKVLISQSLPRRKNDEKSRKNVDLVIQILVNLFDVNRSRIWNENKAVESIGENQVTADELPALDSKWLRKNSSRVFPVLLSVLELLFWDFADPSSLATKVWENYISSIASPAAMEVIVSKETMSFIIGVLGFLYQHWDKGVNDSQISPPSGGAQVAHTYLQSFQTIISITVSGLGVHAFMEKLSKFSQDNLLPVANEYQQLLEKTPNKSPIQHIVNLFTRPCSGIEYDQHYIQLIDYVLKPFLEIRKSPASKLAFLAELGIFPSASANLTPSKMIWEVFANHVVNAISSPDLNRDSMNGCLSLDSYACVVKFLEHGINLSPDQPMPGWCSLFEVILSSATIQAGYSGRALAVIEPLSMVLCITPYGKSYIDLLISNAGYPKDQEELQLAQEIPWSLENPKPVITSLDPYFHLYEYLNFSIISSYKSNDQNSKVISSTNTLLRRCPIELVLSVLCRIKDAISLWIIDEDLNLTGGVQEESASIDFLLFQMKLILYR